MLIWVWSIKRNLMRVRCIWTISKSLSFSKFLRTPPPQYSIIRFTYHLNQWLSNFEVYQNHLEDLLITDCWTLPPQCWVPWVLGEAWGECTFLLCSQVMLMLLVQGPHCENLCSKPFPVVLDSPFLKYLPSAQANFKMSLFALKKCLLSWLRKMFVPHLKKLRQETLLTKFQSWCKPPETSFYSNYVSVFP